MEALNKLEFFNIIGGKPVSSEKHHQVTDPRTEELLWDAPIASEQDLDAAVEAGKQAFKTWKKSTVKERQDYMVKVMDVLRDNKELLSGIVMKETGKSRILGDGEIDGTIYHFDYYRTVALEDWVQYEDDALKIIATHEPLGVIGSISPWNFPLILSSIKVVSAIATGNCVIVKPSPFTPYGVMKFAELAQSVLPPGVLQCLNGGAELGEQMTLHPGIAHISFTGTIAVGKKVIANCVKTLKKVILEMAGNDAAIVTDDVDLEKVVPLVASGSLYNAGQYCVATKRVYVHESQYEKFLEMLIQEIKKYAAPDDAENPNIIGPLDNKPGFENARSIIEDCRKNGYNIVAGGEVKPKGYWIEPTIVANPPEDAKVVQDEQFGPIIPVMSWSSEEDVLSRANIDNAGLGACVYCRDADRARRIADNLECGTVWINRSAQPHPGGFFAGQKLSGFSGELGKQGLLSYVHTKSLQIAKV